MADIKKILTIEVNEKEVGEKLTSITKELSKVQKEQANLNKELKAGNTLNEDQKKQYADNVKRIAELKVAQREATKEAVNGIKTQSGSLDDLKKQLADLVKQRNSITLDTKEGVKSVNKINKDIKALNDTIKDVEKTGGDFRRNVGNYEGALKKFGKAANSVGKTLKTAFTLGGGIILITKAFELLQELLFSNQKVADAFATATNALNIVFRDTFDYLSKILPDIANSFKQVFEDPVGSLETLGSAIEDNLQVVIQGSINALGFLADTVKKIFEGDFGGALDSVKNAAKSFADNVSTGFENGINKISDAVTDGVKSFSDYSKETLNTAKNITEVKKAAELAAAEQGRLTAQFEREAELQRQIRDDETLSIDERIKANEKLAEVLNKREESLTKQAQKEVEAARASLALNNTTENQIALTDALANQESVLNDVTGQRSEQLVNQNSLIKEKQELEKASIQNSQELSILEKRLAAERIEDDLLRLKTLRDVAKEENEIEKERLANNIELYKQGTQDRIDAEREYNQFKIESDNEIANLTKEIDDTFATRVKEDNEARVEATKAANDSIATGFQDLGNTITSNLEEGSLAYKAFAIGLATSNLATELANIATTNTAPTQPGNLFTFGAAGATATAIQSAAAIAKYGFNVAQISGAFAGGGEFITNGSTNIRVGDNPGGRELVTVTPLSGRGQTRLFDNKIQMAGGSNVITDGGIGALNTVSNVNNNSQLINDLTKVIESLPPPVVGVEDIARVNRRVQVRDKINRL